MARITDKDVMRRTIKQLRGRLEAFRTVSFYLNGQELLDLATKNLHLEEYEELLRLAELGLDVKP